MYLLEFSAPCIRGSFSILRGVLSSALVVAGTSAFLGAMPAQAAYWERGGHGVDVLLDDGNIARIQLGYAFPSFNGTYSTRLGSGTTGDIKPDFGRLISTVKFELGDKWDIAVVGFEPWGASHVKYLTGPLANSETRVGSKGITVATNYDIGSGFGVHGGIRYQVMENLVTNVYLNNSAFLLSDYTGDPSLGWLLGASYEIPEIFLRTMITYRSEIKHRFTGTSVIAGSAGPSTMDLSTPDGVTFSIRGPVSESTLLTGHINWSDWSGVKGGSIYTFSKNPIDAKIGVVQRLDEDWALIANVGYRGEQDLTLFSPLGDTYFLDVGARVAFDNAEKSIISFGGQIATSAGRSPVVPVVLPPSTTPTTVTVGTFKNFAWGLGMEYTFKF